MKDEVDRLLTSWRRERPDLDLEPMQVLSRVSRLAKLLDGARRQAFADHGVVAWEFDVLAALRREGTPYQLSPGQLVRETMVTSGTMTNRVDRLVERGLVQREADLKDRRGVIVRLTDEGLAVVDGALQGLLERETELLAPLDLADREQLADLLRSLLLQFEDPAE